MKHRKPKKSVTLERPAPVTRTRLVRTSSGWSRYPEVEEEVVVKQEVKKEESPINILRFNPSPSPVLDPNNSNYGLNYWFSLSYHLQKDILEARALETFNQIYHVSPILEQDILYNDTLN